MKRRSPVQPPRVENLEERVVLGYTWLDPSGEWPLPTANGCNCSGGLPVVGETDKQVRGGAATSDNPVRLFDGTPVVFSDDLGGSASPFGFHWGHTRSWSGLNNTSSNGNGWTVAENPYIVVAGGANGAAPGQPVPSGALAGTTEDERLTVVVGGTSSYTFVIPPTGPYTSFQALGDPKIKLELTSGPDPVLRMTDSAGNVLDFYDVRRDSATGRPEQGSRATDPASKYGAFKAYRAADGSTQVATSYNADGRLDSVTVSDATGVVGRLAYSYATVTNDLVLAAAAPPPEMLAGVTLQRADGAGGWRSVRRSSYTYYTGRILGSGGWANDPNGRLGDLKLALVEDLGPGSVWETVDVKYYRYYKFTGESLTPAYSPPYGLMNDLSTTGGPSPLQPTSAYDDEYPFRTGGSDSVVSSGLKTVVEGAAFARMAAAYSDYDSRTDSELEPYVSYFFKYERWGDHSGADGNPHFEAHSWYGNDSIDWRTSYRPGTRYRVIEEIAQASGCSSCSGGLGTYRYEYTPNYDIGDVPGRRSIGYQTIEYNIWRMKTTEYLPGGSASGGYDRNVVYMNELGQPMLEVFVDVDGPLRGMSAMSKDTEIIDDVPKIVITVTSVGHGFDVGDRVAISGVLPEHYNGVFTIIRKDANTFTFVLPDTYLVDSGSTSSPHVNEAGRTSLAIKAVGEWATFIRYDDEGRVILKASPSAVSGYDDAYYDLLVDVGGGSFAYLRDSAGYIELFEHYATDTATASVAGAAAGLIKAAYVKQGELGAPIVQRSWTYYARTSGGATTYQIATDTVYGEDSGVASDFSDRAPRTTSFVYTWFAGTDRVESMTVYEPIVAAAQNGPGVATSFTVVYDVHGRMVWFRDQEGFLRYIAYDRTTGAVAKEIADVDASRTGDFVGLPAGWSTPAGGGLHLVDAYQADDLGRTVSWTNPLGEVVWTVYNDARHEVRVYRGWNATTHATTGPIEVYREYRPVAGAASGQRAVYYEWLTSSAVPTFNASTHAPTGQEEFASANIHSLRRAVTNNGGQVVEDLDYFSLTVAYASATAHLGAVSNDSSTGAYHQTLYYYDLRGRVFRIVSASGTVSRLVYDGLGRVVEEWVGTNDAGATLENPGGAGSPNNMFRRASYQYDGGSVGDGNLTGATQYPDSVAANARTTTYAYDWRNRLVAMKQGVQGSEAAGVDRPLSYFTYDNLGEVTSVAVYDGDGVALGTTAPGSSLRRSYVAYAYDARGRVYRTARYDVDQSTGSLSSSALKTDLWYGRRGETIKTAEPGGLATKYAYDGAGRLAKVYATDGGGDAAWSDADDVAGDVVLNQQEYLRDAAGRVVQAVNRDRFHDAGPSATGELGTPTTGNRARVSYRAYYYDAAGRTTASVDVGTNGGGAYSRPASAPARSDVALVTSYAYDAAGRVGAVTDPRGVEARTFYDLSGRVVKTVEAFVAPGTTPTDSSNKTVEYAYNGGGDVLSLSVVLPGGGRQTTRYVYGASPTTGSSFHSNDVLAQVRHPDKATGAASAAVGDVESFGYDALGDLTYAKDRNGSVHSFSYDPVGRRTADAATTLGTGVYGGVRRMETAYDAVGRPVRFTSYDQSSGGNVVDQVLRTYNGLGQVTAEYQAFGAAVDTATTPKVQYAYSLMAGGANHSRLTSVTYPSGARVVHEYGSAGGLDDRISRLAKTDLRSAADASLAWEGFEYLGLGTIVRKTTPASTLSYVQAAGDAAAILDGGDQYTGLDRFGRVVDQAWRNGSGTVLDRFQYGYDRAGNRLYKANLLDAALSELYAYDALGQLTSFKRGVLSDTNADGIPDAVAAPSRTQAWDLDAVGNWEQVATNGAAQSRTHNAQNQATGVGGATLSFDANGNMTVDEAGRRFAYDAWNRMVAVWNPSNVLVAAYAHDSLGRRVSSEDRSTATTFTDRVFYSMDWQVLEERRLESGVVQVRRQYFWGPDYVDALVARVHYVGGSPSTVRYAQQDANWNVTSLADAASGAVLERYLFDPYGAVTIFAADWTTRAGTLYDWSPLHQGGRWDGNAGLYHFRNRDYSPTLGRWNRVDPIGFDAGDANLYRYVDNRPTTLTDPTGLQAGVAPKPPGAGGGMYTGPSFGAPHQPYIPPDARPRPTGAGGASTGGGGGGWVYPWESNANWWDWRLGDAIWDTFNHVEAAGSVSANYEVYLGCVHLQTSIQIVFVIDVANGLTDWQFHGTGGYGQALGIGGGFSLGGTIANTGDLQDILGGSGTIGFSGDRFGVDVGGNYESGLLFLTYSIPVGCTWGIGGIHLDGSGTFPIWPRK